MEIGSLLIMTVRYMFHTLILQALKLICSSLTISVKPSTSDRYAPGKSSREHIPAYYGYGNCIPIVSTLTFVRQRRDLIGNKKFFNSHYSDSAVTLIITAIRVQQ
jgi:hypothetical protein